VVYEPCGLEYHVRPRRPVDFSVAVPISTRSVDQPRVAVTERVASPPLHRLLCLSGCFHANLAVTCLCAH